MCGIFGVIGRPDAPAVVHAGLRRLEYRGYDSAGISWFDGDLRVVKAVGPVANLVAPVNEARSAIGHTRWATHGGVTEANAHPHLDNDETVAVVHNGVLLNHAALRDGLSASGHRFLSETDSENLAHLWNQARKDGADAWARLQAVRDHLDGTYSVAFLEGDSIAVAKHRNPLWIAQVDGIIYLSSDAVALAPHCAEAAPLEDGDHGILDRDGIRLHDRNGRPVERTPVPLDGIQADVDKGGHAHFMVKEIHETPSAVNSIIAHHVRRRSVSVMPAEWNPTRIVGLGAGTSYHAALLTRDHLAHLARLPAEAHASPEWKDEPRIPEPGGAIVAFSQSGETLDTVQALARMESHPHPVLAFTNYPQSTIGRQSDATVPLRSGVEVSVAATKTFLSQAVLGHLMAVQLAHQRGAITHHAMEEILDDIVALPRHLARIARGAWTEVGAWLAGYDNVFVLAKGMDLPAAMEGALKLKEIAYQHAEAYPAGELKHGPFALLTDRTPVVFLLGPGGHADSVRNSIQEVAARGSPVLVLAVGDVDVGADVRVIRLPEAPRMHHPFLHAVGLHCLSYWTARARDLPIDKPRNLAKSVTVE